MPKLPLRSRTGCDNCKRRRIKCGEEKPVCLNCQSRSLNCTRTSKKQAKPEDPSIQTTRSSDHVLKATDVVLRTTPVLLTYQHGKLEKGYESFNTSIEFQLCMEAPRLIQTLSGPIAQVQYLQLPAVVALVLEEPIIRNTLSAFSAVIKSRTDTSFKPKSLQYYQTGLKSLRALVSGPLNPRRTVIAIVMMAYLGFTEAYGLRNYDFVVAHFLTILRLFRTQQGHRLLEGKSPLATLMRVTAAAGVIFISDSLLFATNVQQVGQTIDWPALVQQLHHTQYISLDDKTWFPMIGHVVKLFLMKLEVILVSRTPQPRHIRDQVIDRSIRELEGWEASVDYTKVFGSWPDQSSKKYINAFKVWPSGLRVLLYAVRQQPVCSQDPRVRQLVDEIFPYIIEYATHATYAPSPLTSVSGNDMPVWPLAVFLCAVDELDRFEELAATIEHREEFQGTSSVGISDLIKCIRGRKKGYRSRDSMHESLNACDGIHDGFDLLLNPQGVMAFAL